MVYTIKKAVKICVISLLALTFSACSVTINSSIPEFKKLKESVDAANYANKWLENKEETEYFYKAEEKFLQLIEEDENNEEAIINLANLYKIMWESDIHGDTTYFQKSVNMFKEAEAIDPENSEILIGLVELYYNRWFVSQDSKFYSDLAEEYCNKILELSNNEAEKAFANDALCNMYKMLFMEDTSNDELFTKAEIALKRNCENHSDSSTAFSDLGLLYELKFLNDQTKAEYLDLADKACTRAVELDENNASALAVLANIYTSRWAEDKSQTQLYDKSASYYEKAISISPDKEIYKNNYENLKSVKNAKN